MRDEPTKPSQPARFTASRPPFYRKKSRAISWFKDTAHEHVARVRELVVILEHHSVSVRVLKADRVGYIVYQDEFQIVAQPFTDTRKAIQRTADRALPCSRRKSGNGFAVDQESYLP